MHIFIIFSEGNSIKYAHLTIRQVFADNCGVMYEDQQEMIDLEADPVLRETMQNLSQTNS